MKKSIAKILAIILMLSIICTGLPACSKKSVLINPNANEETVRLFEYLKSIYGEKTLSGVTTSGGKEEYLVYKYSEGKRPAIMCFDMMQQTPIDAWHDNAVEDAIEWHTACNGIVEMCWHWFSPSEDPSYRGSFMTDGTKFRPTDALLEGSDENKWINRDIETVAKLLQKMQDAGVPVLWRPFHEASGGWFWWGADGPEVYKELWDYLYDKLTNEYKLNNLIWVWNGQHEDWYVGDDKCDIASMDIYFMQNGNPNKIYKYDPAKSIFDKVVMQTANDAEKEAFMLGDLTITKETLLTNNKKMVALSEVDQIPDPDKMYSEESYAPWLWFAPWYGSYSTTDEFVEYSQIYKIYNHDRIITLDELPEWDDDLRHELSSPLKAQIEKNGQ